MLFFVKQNEFNMISLPVISIAICFAYVIFIVFKYGVPTSISETYYLLPNKWDWMFSAWCTLTSIPFGIWWFTVSPKNLCWIPIIVMIGMTMIGVSCRYKSGPKKDDEYIPNISMDDLKSKRETTYSSFKDFIKQMIEKFKPKNFLKYGCARPIHYVSSLIVIIFTSIWVGIVNPIAIASMMLSYVMFILVGLNCPGVYNKDYSMDVDNKAWIFFIEIICFLQLFIFVWSVI